MNAEISTELAASPLPPGARLAAARIAAGLSVGEIAQALRFSTRQIEALEADDYASLPGSASLRGFVRNYARQLNIDATPLLTDLASRIDLSAPDVRPPESIAAARTGSSGKRRATFKLWLGALAFTVLAIVLAMSRYTDMTLPGVSLILNAQSNAEEAQTVATHPAAAPAPVELSLTDIPAPAVKPPKAAAESAESTPVSMANNLAAPAPVLAAPPAAATVAVAPNSPVEASPAPPVAATLQLRYLGPSWVEIKGGSDDRIIYSAIGEAGAVERFHAKDGYKIVIGRGDQVELTFRGKTVDLKPYTHSSGVTRIDLP